MNKIKEIINNKIIGVMLGGYSINTLRLVIKEIKDYDVCWCAINSFKMMEDFILNEIDKKLSIVQWLAEVEYWEDYEKLVRIPMIKEFVEREDNNLIIISSKILDNFNKLGEKEIYENHQDKFYVIEDPSEWDVPNSLALFIMLLTKYGAEKFILFGCDGYNEDNNRTLDSYFQKELKRQERLIAFRNDKVCNLYSDTIDFKGSFKRRYLDFCTKERLIPAEIVNCNINSSIDIFRRIKYSELKNELNSK
jgi:hypothetical protein